MTAEELEAGEDFGRYLDVDGDGIPYRTYPGTHPTKGAYFTRGTSKDRYARYSEEGAVYVDNMERLLRKFETARQDRAAAGPRRRRPRRRAIGVIYFGSTSPAMARGARRARGRRPSPRRAARPRLPLRDQVVDDFIDEHDQRLRRRAEPRRASCAPC